jgi:hypothetical protein
MLKFVRVAVVVTSIAFPSVGAADDPPDGGEHHRGPSPAAIAACKAKTEGDACSFEGHHGTVEGTCRKVHTGDLACVRPHPHHDSAEN